MKRLSLALLALCFVLPAGAQTNQIPVFTSISPNKTDFGTPVTVTIVGKKLTSGMVLLVSGPVGSIHMKTKVVNQYKATAVIDGEILQIPGIHRIYLMNKAGQIDAGATPAESFQVCFPFLSYQWNSLPPTITGELNYQLTYTGGCE